VDAGPEKSLNARDIQRIVQILRNDSSELKLRGAARILSTSIASLVEIAGVELILQIVRADPGYPSFVANLFGGEYSKSRFLDGHVGSPQSDILNAVAERILHRPDGFSFNTVVAAAKYMVEARPVSLPPLLSQEEALDLMT